MKEGMAEVQAVLQPVETPEVRRKIALLEAIIRVFRETLNADSEEEVGRICLKVAEELTGSAYGFIGELNPDGRFDTTTLSEAGWDACDVPGDRAALLRNMPNRGINRIGLREHISWIVNDPDSHPESSKGKPSGHPQLVSFMGVPLKYLGGITGMIALAGKENGYSPDDLKEVEVLSVAVVEVLNRRRAEKQIGALNAELQHHIVRLEAANRELEAFSYSVSHDLRAPLRHITGFVELLKKRDISGLDPKSRHYLDVVSEGAQKMGTLIDDLLAFSRMGRAEMRLATVDLDQLVGEVIRDLAPEVGEREIAWRIAPLPTVEADPAMLRLVLVNLIGNALKFTRSRRPAVIDIGTDSAPPGEIILHVQDNGVGFDMRYTEKLFGLFQRLHGQEEFEGTGIGLANVQRIVHRHGGRVWAEGAVNRGATFRFSLPAKGEPGIDQPLPPG